MNTIFKTLFKIRLNTISIKINLSFPHIFLNKLPKNNKFYGNYRQYSSQETYMQEIQKKLSENKHANILIYSSKNEGLKRSLLGSLSGILFIITAYNAWTLSSSIKFKKTSHSKEERGFLRSIFVFLASDVFKMYICPAIGLLGKHF
jgi:hypothetical protein